MTEDGRHARPLGFVLRPRRGAPGVRGFLLAQILWVLGYAAPLDLLPPLRGRGARPQRRRRVALARRLRSRHRCGDRARRPRAQPEAAPPAAARRSRPPRRRLPRRRRLDEASCRSAARSSSAPRASGLSRPGLSALSTLIPRGEAGGVPPLLLRARHLVDDRPSAAGLDGAGDGSYRSLFFLGGIATLIALVPLVGFPPGRRSARRSTCSPSSRCSGC